MHYRTKKKLNAIWSTTIHQAFCIYSTWNYTTTDWEGSNLVLGNSMLQHYGRERIQTQGCKGPDSAVVYLSDIITVESSSWGRWGSHWMRWNKTVSLASHGEPPQRYWQCLTEVSNSGERVTAQPASISNCQIYLKLWMCLCKKCVSESKKGSQWPKTPLSFRDDRHILWQLSAFVMFCMHLILCLEITEWSRGLEDNIPTALCVLPSATSSCVCRLLLVSCI